MRTRDDSPTDIAHARLAVAASALAFGVPYVDVFAPRRLASSDIFLRQMSSRGSVKALEAEGILQAAPRGLILSDDTRKRLLG